MIDPILEGGSSSCQASRWLIHALAAEVRRSHHAIHGLLHLGNVTRGRRVLAKLSY